MSKEKSKKAYLYIDSDNQPINSATIDNHIRVRKEIMKKATITMTQVFVNETQESIWMIWTRISSGIRCL